MKCQSLYQEEAVLEAKFRSRGINYLRLLPFILLGCLGLSSCGFPTMPDFDYHLRYWEDYRLRGDRLMQDGKFKEAAQFYKSAVQEAESLGPARLCYSLNRLSGAYLCAGQIADATPVAERSFAIARDAFNRDEFRRDELKEEIALAYSRLADLRMQDKNYSQSSELYQGAIGLLTPLWEHSTLTGHSFLGLGQQLVQALAGQALTNIATGKSDSARESFEKALAIMSTIAIPDPIGSLVTQQCAALSGAALNEEESARLKQARQILENADLSKFKDNVSEREAAYKEAAKLTLNNKNARWEFARAAQGLGDIYALRGDRQLAITWYEEEFRVLRELVDSYTLGLSHPVLALAGLYSNQNRYSDAERLQQLRVDALSKQPSIDWKALSQAEFWLAWSLEKEGKADKAIEYLKRSLGNGELAHKEKESWYATALVRLSRLLDRSGRTDEALKYMKQAVICGDEYGTVTEDERIDFVDRIKNIYREQKKTEEFMFYTRDLQKRLDEWLSTHEGVENSDSHYAFCLRWVGHCYVDEGKFDKAERIFKRAIALQRKLLGPNNMEEALTLFALGDLYYRVGRNSEMESVHREALKTFKGSKESRKAEMEVIYHECPQLKDYQGDSRNAGK